MEKGTGVKKAQVEIDTGGIRHKRGKGTVFEYLYNNDNNMMDIGYLSY